MPTITSIKPQRNQKRFNVYLDNKFAFALSAEALARAGLKTDQEISEEEIEKLRYEDVKDKLYGKVLKFLSYRPRSEWELRGYLDRKKPTQRRKRIKETKLIEEIINKLKKQNLIDDRAFTAWWVEQRSRFRPKGRRLLWIELLKKGIKKEIIEALLFSENEEFDLARKAARKKLKNYKNLEPIEFRKKMTAFLARRGFNWGVIKKVLEEIIKKR